MMGIWATVAQKFQLDPPEALIMQQKRMTLAMFGNDTNFLNCRLYDGVMRAMVKDVVAKVASSELQLVVCSDDQIGS